MPCYKSGGCGAYEMLSCNECPASKPEYLLRSKHPCDGCDHGWGTANENGIAEEHNSQGIKLSNNEVFKYYLGICLKYIKPEHRESIKRYYVESYSNDKYKKLRDIHLLANILLILEYGDVFLIQEKLNLLFLSLSRDDLKMIDDLFLRRIEKCAINGNLIKECFYRDILDDFINEFMDDVSRLMRTLENK